MTGFMVGKERLRPTPRRLCLAFAVAPLASSCVLGFVMMAPFALANGVTFNHLGDVLWLFVFYLYVSAVFGTYPVAMVLGVPAYWMLIGRTGFGPWSPVIVGCIIGLTPGLALMALGNGQPFIGPDTLGTFASMGGIGGFVFWTVAAWRDSRFARLAKQEMLG